MVVRPCLDCREMARPGRSRCASCLRRAERRRNAQPKRRAYLDPVYRAQPKSGVCWWCGLPGADTRDHVMPVAVQMDRWGEVRNHDARPAHRGCNASRGSRG